MDKYYSKTDLLHFIRVKTRYLDDSIIANKGDDSARIKGYAHAFEHFENALTESCDDEIPKADVQPVKHGRWIAENRDNRGYADCYTCTNCDCYTYTYTLMKDCEYDYCPNCGARMDLDSVTHDRCSNYMDCDGSCFIDDTPCDCDGNIEKCKGR